MFLFLSPRCNRTSSRPHRDHPSPSFCINCDTCAGYFLVVHPADGNLRPFWLARAISDPSPNPRHVHMIHIQYWTPSSNRHINMETYIGWNTNDGILWQEDSIIHLQWLNIDCIMIAWKPHFREKTKNSKVTIPTSQINIIKATIAAFIGGENNNDTMVEG